MPGGELFGVIAPSTGEVLVGIGAILILAALGCSVPALVVRRRAQQSGSVVRHLPWLRKVNFGLLAVTVLLLMLSSIAAFVIDGSSYSSQFAGVDTLNTPLAKECSLQGPSATACDSAVRAALMEGAR
ncbi:MAG: hypothetical protein U0929_01870 [Planctomycetaceae bacterium]